MFTALDLRALVSPASLWPQKPLSMLLPMPGWARQSSQHIKGKQEQLSCGFVIPITGSEHIMLFLRMARWSALLCQQVPQSTSFSVRRLAMADTTSQAITVLFM
jgi:hypothetical protein